MDGKSQAWRDAADKLLIALAKENKIVVADMLKIFLESAGYGLNEWSPLGGVFKRGTANGIIKRLPSKRKQALWSSLLYKKEITYTDFRKDQTIGLSGFGRYIDGDYIISAEPVVPPPHGEINLKLLRVNQ